jgi:hypothetical protein
MVVVLAGCGDPAVSSKAGAGGEDAGVDAPRGPQFSLDGGRGDVPIASLDAVCAMQTVQAERFPIDLYLMLDSSLSMYDPAAGGVSKWDAVRSALASFFADAQSAGVGVGLQYFPLMRPDVPADCLVDSECGAYGPCLRARTCAPGDRVQLCDTKTDCRAGQTCELLGGCEVGEDYCVPSMTATCTGGTAAMPNRCLTIPGLCQQRDLCEAGPYGMPAVPIAALPGAAAGLNASLMKHDPDGLTPTGPALTGAHQYARTWLAQNPGRRVAVLLATDGFPVECSPLDVGEIATIAQNALKASPPVPTFVVGVFEPAQKPLAVERLGKLAAAGGSGEALVLDVGQNVTQAFLAALERIRSLTASFACEFKIPPPTMGNVDFDKVNVQVTGGDGRVSTVGRVPDKGACHATMGGWYYNVGPGGAGAPSSILACDATCNQLRADTKSRVDVVLGCRSVYIP